MSVETKTMSLEVSEPFVAAGENPFPGLRSFEAEESDRFFGREGDISELLNRLRHMRFLAVVGASGCGKSSLIKAGLIASLVDGALPGEWRVAVLRPWQSPVAQLAAALSCEGALDVPASSPEEAAAIVKAILQKGSLGIIEALQRYPLPEGDNLLILVDQFEELFTFMDDSNIKGAQEEARAFIKLLLEVLCSKHKDFPVYVALTMRSDFLGHCARFSGLADAINNGLYLLPQMEREQLRDAIKEPVEVSGGKISERLIDTLINDLRDDTDQLPVLQHAMMRLWNQWSHDGGEKIDFEHYKKIGELSATLRNHAEEVFGQLKTEREQQIAEAVFRSITLVKDGDKVVRRQTKFGLIRKSPKLRDIERKEIVGVINEFRADGRSFLIPAIKQEPDDERAAKRKPDDETVIKNDLNDETVIDISHESLIRQWKRLHNWALDEATSRELHRQISDQASIWDKRRDESFLFWGARLFEANDWSKKNDVLSDLENQFLVASQDAHEREISEKNKKELSDKVVAHGATQAASIEKGTAKVFLAYARTDRPFAERLREAFKEVGEETLVDWDILTTEDFEDHVRGAIESADTFVFVISPSSFDSVFCMQELQHAANQNKRIVPVVVRKVEEWKLPEQLRKEYWIRFDGRDDFDAGFCMLREAIKSDLVWVQAHTRLLVRATEWDKRGRDASQLLRGRELSEAEQWLGKEKLEPELTSLQKQYIITSRVNDTNSQRWRFGVAVAAGIVLLLLTATAGYAYYVADREMIKAREEEGRAEKLLVLANKEAAKAREATLQESAARIAETEQRVRAEKAVDNERRAKEDTDQARLKALKAMRVAQLASQAAKRQKDGGQRIAELWSEMTELGKQDAGNKVKVLELVNELGSLNNKLGYYSVTELFLEDFVNEDLLDEELADEYPDLVAKLFEIYAHALKKLGKGHEAVDVMKRARALRAQPKKSPDAVKQ